MVRLSKAKILTTVSCCCQKSEKPSTKTTKKIVESFKDLQLQLGVKPKTQPPPVYPGSTYITLIVNYLKGTSKASHRTSSPHLSAVEQYRSITGTYRGGSAPFRQLSKQSTQQSANIPRILALIRKIRRATREKEDAQRRGSRLLPGRIHPESPTAPFSWRLRYGGNRR